MCVSAAYLLLVPVSATKQKSERFVARVTRDDKRVFQQAASLEGRSMATFVIAHARQAAEEIIARQNGIRLNAEDSSRFVEALLAPPQPPTARMLESIRLYRKRVKSDLD